MPLHCSLNLGQASLTSVSARSAMHSTGRSDPSTHVWLCWFQWCSYARVPLLGCLSPPDLRCSDVGSNWPAQGFSSFWGLPKVSYLNWLLLLTNFTCFSQFQISSHSLVWEMLFLWCIFLLILVDSWFNLLVHESCYLKLMNWTILLI